MDYAKKCELAAKGYRQALILPGGNIVGYRLKKGQHTSPQAKRRAARAGGRVVNL